MQTDLRKKIYLRCPRFDSIFICLKVLLGLAGQGKEGKDKKEESLKRKEIKAVLRC